MFYVGCRCGVRLGCNEYPYYIPLFAFNKYRVVWYSPLTSTIFIGYEFVFFILVVLFLFEASWRFLRLLLVFSANLPSPYLSYDFCLF